MQHPLFLRSYPFVVVVGPRDATLCLTQENAFDLDSIGRVVNTRNGVRGETYKSYQESLSLHDVFLFLYLSQA